MPIPGFKARTPALLISFASLATCFQAGAQDSLDQKPSVSWSVFVDAYYSYDFNKPQNHEKAAFTYNHCRHNEFNINLALVRISYTDGSWGGNLGFMAGTYPQYNLASEQELFRHIYEANLGFRLSEKQELRIDAGILPSHIGFETAISKEAWTLTRSIAADNSPYYEAGVRVSYKTKNDKLYLAGLLVNGWQRIRRVNGNNTPAFGTQITFTPTNSLTLNSSTFIGNDKPDSARKWRYFNDLFAIWQVSKAWGITIGFDAGLEQNQRNSSNFNSWYSPILIVRYQKDGWAVAGRAEYYSDKRGVIVPLVNTQPFQMQGYSLNIDRGFGTNILFRLEGKYFKNGTPYFIKNSTLVATEFSITTSLSILINK